MRLTGYVDHVGESLGIQPERAGSSQQAGDQEQPSPSAGPSRPTSGGSGLARPDLPWDLPALAESDHDDSDEESDDEV